MRTSDRCTPGLRGALLILLLVPLPALASPSYPGVVESELETACPPPCAVCHQDQNGGKGTAIKPVAESMIDQGLEGDDEASLRAALAGLDRDAVDTDGDGISDIAELKAGTDPNTDGQAPICGPQYGCGARVCPSARFDFAAWFVATLALAVAMARRRRRAAR
ncbi:MAG: hypothetical protein KF718_16445 [Polyangiaceae bacterium]|nr:hypothetical protein [Polyangiaceae bacterium]